MERKRRSSHRLRENSKPKFKNTAATAVDLDDDDDFVSPPRETKLADERVLEITSGPTVKKRKGKEVATDVVNIRSGSTTKGKKQKNIDKKLQEKEIRSKRKFENAPSHLKLKLKGKISEIPESKKNDTKKDKRKKVDSEYGPGLRRLSTRMKPGRICEAAAGLSPEQREAVEKMGLGTLLRINMDNLPGLLNYYLLDSYYDASDRLILQNTAILVTKQLISEIMGFEPSGLDFNSLPSCEKTNPILKEWKSQFPDKKYSSEAYLDLIKRTKEDTLMFRLNFLTLFINTFIESMPMGTCQIKVVNKLILLDDYSKIDWCGYMLDSLRTRKSKWKRDYKTSYYTGPMTLLLLIYVYSMKYETIPLNKRPPFIVRVTTKILTAVENFEINSGGFGKRQSDLRDEEYPSEPDVDIDEMVKDFADEEAFCAIVDIGFNKILKEKENMEIALSAGLAKFPESELLISWKNKITHMFYGETDSEDIDSHDKGNENWNDEPYESPKKNEETDKIEDEIQPDDVYKTPLQVVNETRVDTSSMTASQFFDLPGVAEEVIQLVDKTTAEKGLKEKGKDVETKELKHYVRRKRKLPRNLKSPFVSRVVSLSSNVISIEKDFCDSIFVSTRDYDDVIWENDDGESMT